MHKATMQLHLLFWQQAVFSESCTHSNNLSMSFFFIQKAVKHCPISPGVLVMETQFIHNVFSIPIRAVFY